MCVRARAGTQRAGKIARAGMQLTMKFSAKINQKKAESQ